MKDQSLMPNRNHSLRFFLLVILAVLCAVWTAGCCGINGVIVDETTGAPLNDVEITVTYDYPPSLLMLLLYNDYEGLGNRRVKLTADGEFSVSKTHWHWIWKGRATRLLFYKDGYEPEEHYYYTDFETDEDRKNTPGWRDMRVTLRQIHPPAHPPIRIRTLQHLYEAAYLDYDTKKKERRILEFRSSKPVMEEHTHVPFGQKPDAARYLELDFLRDDRGEIVTKEFPGAVDSKGETVKYPAVFLIRLHSDDPDDGFVLFDEGKSLAEQNLFDGKIRYYHGSTEEIGEQRDLHTRIVLDCSAARRRMENYFMELAPEDGYTRREVAIPIEEIVRIWDYGRANQTTWYSAYRFAYLRVGGHYAKAFFQFGSAVNGRAKEVDFGELGDDFRAVISYDVYLNPEKGDRILKEYY